MHLLTNEQLILIIDKIDQAIYNHHQWYKKILRIFISRLEPNPIDLKPEAHTRCDFGKWYESESCSDKTFIKENAAFISLGETHYNVHLKARKLLQCIADKQPIPIEKWDQFDLYVAKMRTEFKLLRDEISERIKNQDPLTGAKNRASMLPTFHEHYALFERDKQDCALAMLDLDHFKHINDTYGHSSGDKVLSTVVECVKKLLRPYDSIYRYGGEEFLLFMPDTNLEQAEVVAERLRVSIAELRIPIERFQTEVQVTASFGVTVFTESRTVEESIDLADEAMYKAKAAGRNRVIAEV